VAHLKQVGHAGGFMLAIDQSNYPRTSVKNHLKYYSWKLNLLIRWHYYESNIIFCELHLTFTPVKKQKQLQKQKDVSLLLVYRRSEIKTAMQEFG